MEVIPQEAIAAAQWWCSQICRPGLTSEQNKTFFETLLSLIAYRLNNHWYPEDPARGQAYRSISWDMSTSVGVDSVLLQAAAKARISNISASFPSQVEHLIMWIDPGEVVLKVYTHGHHVSEEIIYQSPVYSQPQFMFSPYHEIPISV